MTETLPTGERQSGRFDFESYRRYCDDHTIGYRKIGLLDSVLASEAMRDDATVQIELGKDIIPVLVPLVYNLGYEQNRSQEIVANNIDSAEKIFVFTLPPIELDDAMIQSAASQLAGHKKLAIYADYDESDKITPQNIKKIVEAGSMQLKTKVLTDERAEPANRENSVTLYSGDTDISPDSRFSSEMTMAQMFDELVKEGRYEKYPDDGVSVLSGDDINNSSELQSSLWQLYRDRFQWLGENHPLSMEDSQADFLEQLTKDSTSVFVSFREGKPIGMMDSMTSPEACYWLNPNYFQSENLAGDSDRKFMFIPGIVADPKYIGQSGRIITLLAELMHNSDGNYRVVFENTNVSEAYIPKIVYFSAKRSGHGAISFPEAVDKHFYRLYEATANEG